MPAQRPAAAFEPLSPDLDLAALVEQTPNFQYVDRVPCESIESQGIEAFEKLVLLHVILGGKPLVIEGYQNRLSQWTFSTQWLRDNVGKKFEQARSLEKGEYLPLSINHYLDNMPMLAHQWNGYNYKERQRQRLYLKDIDCPSLWHEKLKEVIPAELFYLNDCTGERGGPGSLDERLPHGIGTRKGRGIARAGDLMSALPGPMRAENLMCYIGHEGTYTPAHREMCASLGQNIMVEASGTIGEDGKPTKPGSSIWFMTESKDRHLVSEYWLSSLGHDIEVESHFAQINAWKQAPFTVYIVEQKVGDFLLIPPLAPHQVWNRGTRTMKVAWNRTTVETLDMALHEALPRARMVCRDEQYKNKAIVLFGLNRYSTLLRRVEQLKQNGRDEQAISELTHGAKVKQLRKDFKRLFNLFHEILLSESLSPQLLEKQVEYLPYEGFITCSYCRCNIFNRFLTCKSCLVTLENGDEDAYDICMECYAMGRSCRCLSRLVWVEQFPWKDLLEKHQIWRDQFIHIDGKVTTKTPLPLKEARNRYTKKTLAHICQEQLRSRPFKDPKNLDNELDAENESESDGVNDDGTLKKKPKKRRSEKWLREHLPCHICMHREVRWKLAVCSCGTAYCYGSLWRAFDTMPQTVMEDLNWKCPKCRKICNCSICMKNPSTKPHEPKGTVLGHDTRKFADPRSVESLVDFSSSNIHWLKKAGDEHPTESRRIERRKSEAAIAKSQPTIEDNDDENAAHDMEAADVPIDPRLANSDADNNIQMKQAALALHAMDGLSQLEQDPQAFMSQAGISDGRFVHNGIDYEYPDPDATSRYLATATSQQSEDKEISKVKSKQKKKRKSNHMEMVQSNAAVFTDDANKRFYLQQSHKTLAEAKKTGRFIIAKAAITGDSLIVTFKADPWRLARIGPTNQALNGGEEANQPTPTLVQSDLPKHVPADVAAQRTPQVPKKRQHGEVDEDFVTKKRIVETQPEDNHSVSSSDDIEMEEDDDNNDIDGQRRGLPSIRGAPKRRSLPAYLARKSPVEGDELPKELSYDYAPRRAAQLKPSSNRRSTLKAPKRKATTVADSADQEQQASVTPIAAMSSIMAFKEQEPRDNFHDADFNMEDHDALTSIVVQEQDPSTTMDFLTPAITQQDSAPQVLSSASNESSSRNTSGKGPKSPPQTSISPKPQLPIQTDSIVTKPTKPPSAENLSNESSEFEAPPKPKTPTESERSTTDRTTPSLELPSAMPNPERKSGRTSKHQRNADQATLNRLAKQRAAAGELVTDDSDSYASSSDESLYEKEPKKTTATKNSLAKINATPGRGVSSPRRGRGRPKKSNTPQRSEVKSVQESPAAGKPQFARRGRGNAKIVASQRPAQNV